MRNTTRLLLAAALGVVSASALAQQDVPQPVPAAQPPADQLPRIFSPAPLPENAQPAKESSTFQPMFIDIAYLDTVAVGDWIGLNASPTRTFAGKVETVTHRSPGCYSIMGRVDNQDESFFVLVVEHDAVAGSFMSPGTREHFKLRYQPGGVHLVCLLDHSKFLPCGGSEQPVPTIPGDPAYDPVPDVGDGIVLPEPDDDGAFDPRGSCGAPQTVFDGMVAYTDDVRVAMGGANAVHAEIQQTVDVTNTVYQRSGIAARYRLVWRGEVAYGESGNSSTDLGRLQNPSDGFVDGVLTTRDSVNADVVTLWLNSLDACGRGYCTSDHDNAVNVVKWDCAADNFSQPHEIGHNQGCDHNVEDSGGGCAAYSYSFGHRFFVSGTGYRTVMSYDNDAEQFTRIGYFSNPNVSFLGTATGTATRDNTRTVNNRRGAFEGLELTRMDVWVQIGYSGIEIGTFALPYNTVSEGVAQVDVPNAGASEDPNLYIKAGTSTYTGTITKQMWIRACGGTVNIGGNP